MMLAAHQPQYLPYPGLLAKIAAADVFVLLDTLQYTKHEWQNRNRVRTAEGWRWLTIPVHAKYQASLTQVRPVDQGWLPRHKAIVSALYRQRPLEVLTPIWEAAASAAELDLATLNGDVLRALLRLVGIRTPVIKLSEIGLSADECATRDARLISLCRRLNCSSYLSGSGARAYLASDVWGTSGIELWFMDYDASPYEQCFPGWVPYLSSIDLLLSVGQPLRQLWDDTRLSRAV